MKLITYKPQLTPWTSFDRLSNFRDLLEAASFGSNGQSGWVPPLDLSEDADKVTVSIEVAGLKKEDFEIALEDDTLTISGERKNETEAREGTTTRTERSYGRFSRTVRLATPVKADEVKAEYADGVLTVVLPKAEEAKPRRITVG
jgi:HSP20 family protein